jgi:hypothetical protein
MVRRTVTAPSGFCFGFDESSRTSLLSINDAVRFVSTMDLNDVHNSGWFHTLLPWQKKLIHNERVTRFVSEAALGLAAEHQLEVEERLAYETGEFNENGERVYFPHFLDDLEDDDDDNEPSKFVRGVWKEVETADFLSPFTDLVVDDDRFHSLRPLEEWVARSQIGIDEEFADTERFYLLLDIKMEIIRDKVFDGYPVYWPEEEGNETQPEAKPEAVSNVQELVSQARTFYVKRRTITAIDTFAVNGIGKRYACAQELVPAKTFQRILLRHCEAFMRADAVLVNLIRGVIDTTPDSIDVLQEVIAHASDSFLRTQQWNLRCEDCDRIRRVAERYARAQEFVAFDAFKTILLRHCRALQLAQLTLLASIFKVTVAPEED